MKHTTVNYVKMEDIDWYTDWQTAVSSISFLSYLFVSVVNTHFGFNSSLVIRRRRGKKSIYVSLEIFHYFNLKK